MDASNAIVLMALATQWGRSSRRGFITSISTPMGVMGAAGIMRIKKIRILRRPHENHRQDHPRGTDASGSDRYAQGLPPAPGAGGAIESPRPAPGGRIVVSYGWGTG